MIDPEIVVDIIRETAQQEVLPRFRMLSREDIREKAPRDFVTVADLEAERELARRLTELVPRSVVLGEEAAAENPRVLEQLAGAAPVWVIDPIDGTANFARGHAGFAMILALVQDATVRAGWIYDPLDDVMATAEAGEGAWSDGRRLKVAGAIAPAQMIGAAYGRIAGGPRAAQALTASGRIAAVRNRGSSGLEYLDILRGRAHFSLHSRSLPWDHAAGILMVKEAEGIAGFLDGSPYDPRVPDRPVLAAASRTAWDTVRDVAGSLA
jgi:fructose-1,6-bisphosphatase/inositol monophosphatase family enzyme